MRGVQKSRLSAVIKLSSAIAAYPIWSARWPSQRHDPVLRIPCASIWRCCLPKKNTFYTIIIAKQVHRVQRLLRRLDLFYFCSHIVEAHLSFTAVVCCPLLSVRTSCEYAQLLFSSSVATMSGGKWAAIESEGETGWRSVIRTWTCADSRVKSRSARISPPHNGISFRFRGSLILIHYLHNTEAISRSAPLSSFIFDLLFYSRLLPFDAKIINLDGFRYSWTRFSRFFGGKSRRFASSTRTFPSQIDVFHFFLIAWSHRMHPTRPSLVNYGIEKLRRSFPLLHKSLSMKTPRLKNLRKCMLLRNGAGH